MNEKRSCQDCLFLKTSLNEKEMVRQGKDEREPIWQYYCENTNVHGAVVDLSKAEACSHYEEDSCIN